MTSLNPVRRRTVQEIGRVSSASFTVVAGALTQLVDINPLNYPFTTVLARANAAHSFDIVVSFRTSGATLPLGIVAPSYNITDLESDGVRAITNWIESRSDRLTVYIRNNDTVDHTYDALIYGIG